jgi:hypothetical protein
MMDLTGLTDRSFTSVAELIDFAEPFEDLPPPNFPMGQFAFRGQSREFGTLVPSFRRQFDRDSVGAAVLIERRLIDEFRKHYAELADRSSDMPHPSQIGNSYDLRCLSVMQHYEIPTRLLDWTSCFWTAVYFACASEPTQNAELWYYDRRLFELQTEGEPQLASLLDPSPNPAPEPQFLGRRGETLLVELDPQLSQRMKDQKGHHTVSADVFADHAPLLSDLADRAEAAGLGDLPFKRVVIDSSCKGKVLQFLADHEGITASTIFPDVVGLSRFLRWQFESLRTMMF